MKKANEIQVGGEHYQTEIQHWDFVWANHLDYFQGQITKYVCRWKGKNGVEDLKKAQHFLQKYIELAEASPTEPRQDPTKWIGFTFEGQTGEGKTLYKCQRCGKTEWVPEGRDPQAYHLCDFSSLNRATKDLPP